jgi:hypothetical protein
MIIEKNSIKIDLPKSLEEFDYFSCEPFHHFVKHNFIDTSSFNMLVSEIHEFEDFDYAFTGKGDKSKRSINGSNVSKLAEGTFKNFCLLFFDKRFYNWFKSTHLPHFRSAPLTIYCTKPRSQILKIFAKLSKFLKLPLTFFYTEIEYSSIKEAGFIPPHTDSGKKRLSFVIYLPDPKIVLSNEMKSQLGTVFWEPKDRTVALLDRFDCSLLMGEERSSFYRYYKKKFTAQYAPNCMVGFVKSSNSWHSVEPWSFPYDRRAIVINIWSINN